MGIEHFEQRRGEPRNDFEFLENKIIQIIRGVLRPGSEEDIALDSLLMLEHREIEKRDKMLRELFDERKHGK